MTARIAWNTVDLAGMARAGLTIGQIADEFGASYDAARAALNRRGIARVVEGQQTPRQRIQTMRPREAVAFLLDIVETLAGAAPPPAHPSDAWGLSKSESRVAKALMDAAGATVSVERLHSTSYADAVPGDGLPKRETISVYVYNIRRKMPAGAGAIVTVWGEGYRYQVGVG